MVMVWRSSLRRSETIGSSSLPPNAFNPKTSVGSTNASDILSQWVSTGLPTRTSPTTTAPRARPSWPTGEKSFSPHRSLTPGEPLTTPTAGGRRWKRPSRWCFGTLGPLWTSSTSPNEEKTTYIASWNIKYTWSTFWIIPYTLVFFNIHAKPTKSTSQHEINRIDCWN